MGLGFTDFLKGLYETWEPVTFWGFAMNLGRAAGTGVAVAEKVHRDREAPDPREVYFVAKNLHPLVKGNAWWTDTVVETKKNYDRGYSADTVALKSFGVHLKTSPVWRLADAGIGVHYWWEYGDDRELGRSVAQGGIAAAELCALCKAAQARGGTKTAKPPQKLEASGRSFNYKLAKLKQVNMSLKQKPAVQTQVFPAGGKHAAKFQNAMSALKKLAGLNRKAGAGGHVLAKYDPVFASDQLRSIGDFKGAELVDMRTGLYDRAYWRVATKRGAMAAAPQGASGRMQCTTCSKPVPDLIITKTKKGLSAQRGWQYDHYKLTWAQRVKIMKEMKVRPPRSLVRDIYQQDVRVTCKPCNEGHMHEPGGQGGR